MNLPSDSPRDAIRRILAESFRRSVCSDNGSALGKRPGLELIDDYLERAWTFRQELFGAVNLEVRAVKTQRNLHATIHKLPVELLVYIFQLALPSPKDGPHYIQSIDTLLRVCTRWTTIINGAPSLWTVVTPACGANYLAWTLAKLGSNYPLHIHCDFLSDGEFTPILREISPHIHRWETAVIVLPQTEEGRQYLSAPAPRLRRLHLSVPSGTRLAAEGDSQPFDIFNGSADWVEDVKLTATCLPWNSSILRGLKSLYLQWCKPIRVSNVISILNGCPDLGTLVFEDTEITVDMQPDPLKAVSMTKLENIYFHGELQGTREVISGFKAPNCLAFGFNLGAAEPHDSEGFLLNTLAPFYPFFRHMMLQHPKAIINKSMQDVFQIQCGFRNEDEDVVSLSLRLSQATIDVMMAFLRRVLGEDQSRKPDVRLIIGRDWVTEGVSILNEVSSYCNVVDLWLGAWPMLREFDTESTLRALTEPGVLLHLRHLIVAGDGWDGDEIKAILRKRYNPTNGYTTPLRIRLVGRGVNANYRLVWRLEQLPMIEEASWNEASKFMDRKDL
ncbi:hypothetical protein M407DRAFT_229976 [Tulasnella calospora MUT 4182]|uniref:F-box domain-containing protein n=1 Tax=Tulasnella calospora MUT 4182 TaxID=1051891 RepID=A0A0C3QNF2_9AGAM|nr:hypothetical protein M407DRAFT_229976 [Tulasnella calospora MUT 4182]